ncbi:MAG: HEAT repeat domain-containing protein [Actinomycetota bacterium]|nr:HEAT repeat domain-containing protein [Actinomycetota bacterium]
MTTGADPRGSTTESARRRAEVALLGRSGDEPAVRARLADRDGRVRVAAAAALARIGSIRGDDLAPLLGDPDPELRRDTCEIAARVPGAPVAPLLADPDPRVVEAAAFAVGELALADAVPELARVALSHSDRLCRESAVAALGAIGDERGLGAVLAATRDSPAIRRRAVVALAAFSGPDVDAALRIALGDRDWQVRQAAEDVLGVTGGEPS